MKSLVESFDILKGLPLVKTLIVNSVGDLEKVNFPYYMKINSGGHKLKMGGVVLCQDLKSSKKNYEIFKKKFKESIIVQEEVRGVELIIGIKEDLVFGKMILVGLGGSFVEEKGDVSFRSLPVTQKDIHSMLSDLSLFESLEKKGFSMKKFVDLIKRVADLSEEKNIIELDLNPVIFNKLGVFVVDSRIEVSN